MTSESASNEYWFPFEGHRVFYTREGAGDTILFLPNATLTGKLWEHQLDHFRSRYDVIAVDLPGFGRSDRIDGELTLELYVRWLERFVTELELAPVTIVGNCMGSLSALHFAAQHPGDVWALVLLHTLTAEANAAGANGPGTRLARMRGMYPVAKFFMRHMPAWRQRRFPYPREQFGPVGNATGRDYLDHALRCFADPETRAGQVGMVPDIDNWVLPEPGRLSPGHPPICWIWGDANRLLPLEAGRHQLDVLKPDEVHILKGCGYAAAWEAPEQVNRIIERFLERHRPIVLADGRRVDATQIAFP